jgi:phage terminase Nu1 subunit (DNA packaging protein)
MKFPVKISTSELAVVLGINERTVGKLVGKKILRREARGCFDLTDALQAYLAYREGLVAAEHGSGTYGKARAQLYLERARMARLKREEIEGELLPSSKVLAGWSAILANVKARMLAIPSKCAPRLVGLKSAAEAKAIIETEVYEALEEASSIEIRVSNEAKVNGQANE